MSVPLIKDIERSLFNEVFEWSLINIRSDPLVGRQLSADFASNSGQLYADSVCLNPEYGITYARSQYQRTASGQPIRVTVLSPKESRIGDIVVVKVYVEKTSTEDQNCIPVKNLKQKIIFIFHSILSRLSVDLIIGFKVKKKNNFFSFCFFKFQIQLVLESSESYELLNRPEMLCFCGNSSQPSTTTKMLLKPKRIGLIDIRLTAKYPNHFSRDCIQTSKTIRFETKNLVKHMTVSPMGIVSKYLEQQIICNNNNNERSFHKNS